MLPLKSTQVLVTVGTACTLSAVGSTETYQALVARSDEFLPLAAFDAGLVELDPEADNAAHGMRWATGEHAGEPVSLDELKRLHGDSLRANSGIRHVPNVRELAPRVVTDIAAPLPHDLETVGLRRLAGLRYEDIRGSGLKDMHGLFQDDPLLSPSLQAQLFAYGALGALAGLPRPLSELVPNPFGFRVASATAFGGNDALGQWLRPDAPLPEGGIPKDTFAVRLAHSLGSHGPALVSTMLSPSYSISRVLKNPELRESLRSDDVGFMRVPQAPMTAVGACASSLVALADIAPQLLFDYPGFQKPQMVLLTAADAALQPRFGILEAFGGGALMTGEKLATKNAAHADGDLRTVHDSLAPFDIDADGTVVGHGGSGLLVTTLDFALRNQLDITSLIVGWGQSAEAGGKAHFAGVGFGGENALVQALDMAFEGHGYGVHDFQYLAAHATGTRTNSKTDLGTALAGLRGAAQRQGLTGELPRLFVGTPKAVGDGHTMGETGLKALSQALQFVLGRKAPGVPTLRRLDPDLADVASHFHLQADPSEGNPDGGAICATQGFGGYNGAVALRSATPASLAKYECDAGVLAAYLDAWPTIRADREKRERMARRSPKLALNMAERHRWAGLD
jgi:3-oxoacyl-(acyl-carrier-protein) synthase